nr:MAG TPA: hypothetical protein [Caudoviricetes sp.]
MAHKNTGVLLPKNIVTVTKTTQLNMQPRLVTVPVQLRTWAPRPHGQRCMKTQQ